MKIKSISKKLIALFALAATLVSSVPAYAADGQAVIGSATMSKSNTATATVPADTIPENAISLPKINSDAKSAIYPSVFSNNAEVNLLYYTTLIRVLSGVEPLSAFSSLQNAADTRLNELVTTFETYRPDGSEFTTVFDDHGIDWDWGGELIGCAYEDTYEYILAHMDDEVSMSVILDPDFTHIGISCGMYGSTPYYEQLFHGECVPTDLSIWNEQDIYYVPNGSLGDLYIFFQVTCEHGVSYFPFIEDMNTNLDTELLDQVQQVTMNYRGLSHTFDVMIYSLTNFSDVHPSQWYYNSINYIYRNNIMNGLTSSKFGVNDPIRRGQFATILHRLEGTPANTGSNSFKDVPSGEYYYDAIGWANSVGIVTGFTADTFGPDQSITREQMALMMYRYANYLGYDTNKRAPLTTYRDDHMVSSYATTALSWAVAEGLINGLDSTTLGPLKTADRAQCATIIQRFMQNIMQ